MWEAIAHAASLVKDARDEASRIRSEAEAEVSRLLSAAREEAADQAAKAVAQARRQAEEDLQKAVARAEEQNRQFAGEHAADIQAVTAKVADLLAATELDGD